MDLRPRHAEADAVAAALEDELYAFNQAATGHRDGRDLAFTFEDEGRLVGGVAGYTWGRICEIRQLWVSDDRRGSGLGSKLLSAAIGEARARGARRVYLTTYDFQAPQFYRRHGFLEAARIDGKPDGHTEHVMRLDL